MATSKIMLLLYVAVGGAIGSVARYLVISGMASLTGFGFPYGTLLVNISGSFLMGALIESLTKYMPGGMGLRAFLAVGILGGYTTFSSFSLDAITLYQEGKILAAATYTVSSVVLSLLAIFIGIYVFREVL